MAATGKAGEAGSERWSRVFGAAHPVEAETVVKNLKEQ
jgi:hypothetical protein